MTEMTFERALPDVLTQADNLPSLPAVAMEILRLTQDEDCTLDDLALALSRDPALAAKLLKLANSSLFNLGQEVTTLQRAAMVLGMKTVKLMSLSFSLIGSIPSERAEDSFDYPEYWRRSLVAAVSARSLAKELDIGVEDEAFLCGLLGHFGKLVLVRCLAEQYADVLQAANGWPTEEKEQELMGFSSTDVCATLLKSWNLPAIVYMTVGHWHRRSELPQDADGNVKKLLGIMEATTLCERILCDEEKGGALNQLRASMLEGYGLEESAVDDFLLGLESGITETAEMLSIESHAGTSHQAILDEARMQIVNVSLGTAVDLHQANQRTAQLETENRQLESQALTDKLTGLPNRAAFDDCLERQVQSRLRGNEPRALGLVMIDIDRFKSFNDTYGHSIGDEVLRMVGGVLKRMTRRGDLAARYGGEEFALIAPHTNTFGLRTVAERLRAAIEAEVLEVEGKALSVTASFGAACVAAVDSEKDGPALIRLADHYLYKAKEAGRNRAEVYPKVHFPGR